MFGVGEGRRKASRRATAGPDAGSVRAVSSAARERERSRGAERLQTLAVLAAAGALLLTGLSRTPLLDPDEGRHAGIARRMGEQGRWIRPEIYGEPYDHKPTGFYWLVQAAGTLPIAPETAARLPSALATIATVVLLHRWALGRFGRAAAGLGAAIFLTAPEVVVLGRFCNLDASLSFFVSAATLAWLVFLERLPSDAVASPGGHAGAAPAGAAGRMALVAWLAMALGTLIKGPVAVVLPLAVAAAAAATRGRLLEVARAARPVAGVAIIGAVFGGWLVAAAFADPAYPWNFLFQHNLQRFTSAGFDHHEGPFFLIFALAAGFLPWSLCLPAALAAPRAVEPGRADHERNLLLWAGTIVLFFTASESKLATYVLPAFGPLAFWLGSRLERAGERAASRLRAAARVWGAGLGLLALAVPVGVALALPHAQTLSLWALAVLIVALVFLRDRGRARATLIRLVAGSAALLAVAALGVGPGVARVASDAGLAGWFLAQAQPGELVAYRIEPASLSWYTHREIRREPSREAIVALAAAGPLVVATRPRRIADLERAGFVFEKRIDNGRHVLLVATPERMRGKKVPRRGAASAASADSPRIPVPGRDVGRARGRVTSRRTLSRPRRSPLRGAGRARGADHAGRRESILTGGRAG